MKKATLIGCLSLALISIGLFSCKNDEESTDLHQNELSVRLLTEEVCCGNMIILNNKTIARTCEIPDDGLLRAVNLEEYGITLSDQGGDILKIKYELTEDCAASCGIDCNRHSAIPIKLLSVK